MNAEAGMHRYHNHKLVMLDEQRRSIPLRFISLTGFALCPDITGGQLLPKRRADRLLYPGALLIAIVNIIPYEIGQFNIRDFSKFLHFSKQLAVLSPILR